MLLFDLYATISLEVTTTTREALGMRIWKVLSKVKAISFQKVPQRGFKKFQKPIWQSSGK